ncbi:MAG TPA: ATP-binding protein [Bacteroidales bacterium]|jgi:predicted HTH transcriptional regulator|nr:ATP-binding protein [Bacteroidales bacterium]HBZ21504.1 ATP-binding protein [Bacteroidales bacterium]
MEHFLKRLIADGENLHLDFKYCVSDSRKIARTLSAFANSDGGKILIGVRDNGSVAGIKTDEEIYMVDTAAHLFCRPEISYTIKQHTTGGKTILEVDVLRGTKRPYQVKDENGKWLSYFRNNDQNLLANRVLLQVWRKEEKERGVLVKFSKAENSLMNYLKENRSVTLSKFRKIAGISSYKAEAILSNLIIFRILNMKASEKGFFYELNPEEPAIPCVGTGSIQH